MADETVPKKVAAEKSKADETVPKKVAKKSKTKKAKKTGGNLTQLLIYGALQGILIGVIVGGLLGLVMWRNALQNFLVQQPIQVAAPAAVQPAVTCPSCPTCPSEPVCPDVPPATTTGLACEDEGADLFMKRHPDVDNYNNPRLVPLQNIFSKEQRQWIITQGSNARQDPTSAIAFSRDSESWAWIYDTLHRLVYSQNEKNWKYRIPQDFHSELVENVHFVSYTPDNYKPEEGLFSTDIGVVGPTGKRVLSVVLFLNGPEEYEGGQFVSQINKDEYPLDNPDGLLWLMNAFVLKKKLPVTSGAQHVLHYWVERY